MGRPGGMILLDTCVFLWLNEDPAALPVLVMDLIRKTPVGNRFVSAMTALEIAIKARKGRLQIPGSQPRLWFDAAVAERGLSVIPITVGIAFRSASLPDLHKDPADRVIIATAIEHHLTIVTPDRMISQYPKIKVSWA
ncbi:type II toxin-antitoxin system VapC family toxin [bacterium]|nr:type II toxin-antitoxin system VapC family toxin [bacterium]